MKKMETRLIAKATEQLQKEVDEELNIPDPKPEVAKAILIGEQGETSDTRTATDDPENRR